MSPPDRPPDAGFFHLDPGDAPRANASHANQMQIRAYSKVLDQKAPDGFEVLFFFVFRLCDQGQSCRDNVHDFMDEGMS